MNLINELKAMGYKYIIMPKRNRSNFWATKAEMINGNFDDNDDFDEYADTDKIFAILPKGVFINLNA